jgi:hypothetical protein
MSTFWNSKKYSEVKIQCQNVRIKVFMNQSVYKSNTKVHTNEHLMYQKSKLRNL